MKKVWDNTLKRLIKANPQDFVSFVLQGARYETTLGTELKNWTIEADTVLDVRQHNDRVLLHIEFQSKKDTNMAQRLLEYNVLATREHQCHILSCVIYLREDDTITEESPLMWTSPGGQIILIFHYTTIKLWEIPAEKLLQSGLTGLFPLLPLAGGGKQDEVVNKMIDGIATAQQWHLLPLSKVIAGLVFTAEGEYQQMLRRFAMFDDILEESRVYQDILQKGMVQGVEQGIKQGVEQGTKRAEERALNRDRQIILAIIQRRFPDMLNAAKQYIEGVQDPEQLQNLVIKISLAQDSHEVRLALAEAEHQE